MLVEQSDRTARNDGCWKSYQAQGPCCDAPVVVCLCMKRIQSSTPAQQLRPWERHKCSLCSSVWHPVASLHGPANTTSGGGGGLQRPAMGRSSGRQGAPAGAQEEAGLAEELGLAWQCDPRDVSVGRESTLARLWAGWVDSCGHCHSLTSQCIDNDYNDTLMSQL